MLSLLSYGEALIDLLPMADQQFKPMAGGAPANVAVAYAKLGGKSYFAGALSTDAMGKRIEQQLSQFGVNDHYIKRVSNNTALVLVTLDNDGERSFQFYREQTADTCYSVDDFDAISWSDIDLVHFCSNTLTSELMYQTSCQGLGQAKRSGSVISYDVNLRLSLWHQPDIDSGLMNQRIESFYKIADIIKFSLEELSVLAKVSEQSVENYLAMTLAQGVKLILVTNAEQPIQVYGRNFKTRYQPPVIKAVDTTAAGDSFIAGFLFSLSQQVTNKTDLELALINQAVLEQALSFASRCSAYTCRQKGAFSALPELSNVS